MATRTLRIPDIHCDGCLRTIATTLRALPGVESVAGDPQRKVIQVEFLPEVTSPAVIERTLTEAGHPPAGATAPAARRRWVALLLLALAGGGVGWLGYRVGFWNFVTAIAMPEAFGQYPLVLLALGSGVAAFFSPCVFPLLPAYVTYDLGLRNSGGNRLVRALALGAAAALGLVVVNAALGVIIAVLGRGAPFQPDPRRDAALILVIRTLAGGAIAWLGVLALLGRSPGSGLLARFAATPPGMSGGGFRSMFRYGFLYNAAGIGCTGPILLSLTLFALAAGTATAALQAFAIFSLTMAALMVGVTLLVGYSQVVLLRRLRGAVPALHRLGGAVMVVVGSYTAISLATGPGRALFVRIFFPFLQ
jgi:cytochrome c-type biogenesis protein